MNKTDWHPERRGEVRVDLLAELEGHIVTLDEQVQVRQLSLGGMLVETTAPLSPRVDHDFRLSLGERSLTVRARVVHSRVAIERDAVTYLSGVQFADPTSESLASLRSFIDMGDAAGQSG